MSPRLAVSLLLLALCAAYLPDVGHGFVKDDFVWIARSDLASAPGVLTSAPTGFYRPVVSLSFGVNRWACGLNPLCYGVTNFLLLLGCAAGVFALARSLSLPWPVALAASAIWAFNWNGINAAVLWISGRTALLLVLFSTWSAAAFVSRRWPPAIALLFAALFSKEEAVLLPVVFVAWVIADALAGRSRPRKDVLWFAVACGIVESLYFFLRAQSGAFTSASAPPFYRLDFSISRLFENAHSYADRSSTFALVIVFLFWLACRPGRAWTTHVRGSPIRFGLLWLFGGFAITVFLPVRSSLYACLPSVGVALIAAAIINGGWQTLGAAQQRRAVILGMVLPFLLWPLYYSRNRPSVQQAELSTKALGALQGVADRRGSGTVVVLQDDRARRPSLDNAFGTLLQEAVDLTVEPRITAWIEPPPVDAELAGLRRPGHVDVTLALRDGAFVEAYGSPGNGPNAAGGTR